LSNSDVEPAGKCASQEVRAQSRIPAIAWAVAGLLFLVTVLNYMDRQTLSMAAPLVQKELHLDNARFGLLASAFFFTYGAMMGVTGWILDRVSIRWGYAACVLVWSMAGALTGASSNFSQLFACRLLLGIGEAANWPAALRVISRILPPEKRSFGNGLFNSGASIGAVITPPLMVYLSIRSGWRFAFVVIGLLGIVWVAAWLAITRWMPSIEEPRTAPGAPKPRAADSAYTLNTWSAILKSGRFWGLIVSSITYNPCYYFYSTWLPTYFVQQRGIPFGTGLGRLMMVPYIAFGIGSILGGLPVIWLNRRGWAVRRSRKLIVSIAVLPMLPIFAVPHVKNLTAVLAIIFVMAISLGAWISQYLSALQDVSERQVSSVSGIIGAFGAFAGALGMWGVGIITSKTGGFTPIFVALAVMPVIATLGIVLPRWPYASQSRS
jgi:MFS transporter, ACS family, hexuronate transporter